jgi:hypothetical protein
VRLIVRALDDYRGSIRAIRRKYRQFRSESFLNAWRIGCGQSAFGAENSMRLIGSRLGRIDLLEFEHSRSRKAADGSGLRMGLE